MRELTFESSEDFRNSFVGEAIKYSLEATDSIEEAFREGQKEAKLFQIAIEDVDYTFQIVVPKKDWLTVLEAAFERFQEADMVDRTIDTWTLIRDIKEGS